MKYTKQTGKNLYSALKDLHLLEYGAFISGDLIRNLIGLEYPQTGSKKTFDQLALCELAAIDYVRNILLGQGKYLNQACGDYRIYLPSENAKQVERYISVADNKLRRALKLQRNTPSIDTVAKDDTAARIAMKRKGLRDQRKHAEIMS